MKILYCIDAACSMLWWCLLKPPNNTSYQNIVCLQATEMLWYAVQSLNSNLNGQHYTEVQNCHFFPVWLYQIHHLIWCFLICLNFWYEYTKMLAKNQEFAGAILLTPGHFKKTLEICNQIVKFRSICTFQSHVNI